MNIRDAGMWPADPTSFADVDAVFDEMATRRRMTFLGFSKLESVKGVLIPGTPFSSSRGQEMLRVLLFRTLEELGESMTSRSRDHRLEELIDASNYLLSIPILPDPDSIETDGDVAALIRAATRMSAVSDYYHRLKLEDIGQMVVDVSLVTDHFRNRSWMHNAQDLYFNGHLELNTLIVTYLSRIMLCFGSLTEFFLFWIAKDNVLQFRLRSQY